jgi:hypothetical protein
MHDHAGWRIGVRSFEVDGQWSARVEVWEPGTGPHTHNPLQLPFNGKFDASGKAESAAVDRAKQWIDMQPTTRRKPA